MTTKPALQKIIKGIIHPEEEEGIIHPEGNHTYTIMRAQERINLIRRPDMRMRIRKEPNINNTKIIKLLRWIREGGGKTPEYLKQPEQKQQWLELAYTF